MTNEDIERIIIELADIYDLEINTIEIWYKELLGRSCFNIDDTYDCLDMICSQVVETRNEIKEKGKGFLKEKYKDYKYSENYIINCVLHKVYGENATLDDVYLEYMGITDHNFLTNIINSSNPSQLILKLQYDGNCNYEDME